MRLGTHRRTSVVVAVAAVISVVFLPSALARGAATLTVLADGLDNPRGITIGEDGDLFVAESGRGGTNCKKIPGFGKACFGMTASITRVAADGSSASTVVKLPSGAGKDGVGASGASDVAVEDGVFFVAMGGAPPNAADVFGPKAAWFNDLLTAKPRETVADLGKYEANHDPDGAGVDSNPYAVARVDGGTIVADAGGNSLLFVADGSSKPKLVATFPTQELTDPDDNVIPAQAVPNTVTVGPDGAWYVGQLTGFPFTPDASRVWRIEPGTRKAACDADATTGPCTLYADGLTAIIDIAFGPDGKLYVLEIAKNGVGALEGGDPTPEDLTGALLRMDGPDTFTEIASEGLVTPAGLAISDDGRIFVTNHGIFPGDGEVVEVVA
jgi:sugar lactone lactonase YvrE